MTKNYFSSNGNIHCNGTGVSIIKAYHVIKKVVLFVVLLMGFVLLLAGRIPQLPSSKTAPTAVFNTDVRLYLRENLTAIAFFIISLILSVMILGYSALMRRHANSQNSAGIRLGGFILLSGIWILTDSRALAVFTTNCGGFFSMNAVIFISYLSIMLMPMVFISFLKRMIPIGRTLQIIDGLFLLNLTVFVTLIVFQLPKEYYFIFLAIHHALIYLLVVMGTVYFMRDFRSAKDPWKQGMARGIVLFTLCSGAALLIFLLGSSHMYAAVYGVGFIILIFYMVKITAYDMLATYKEVTKLELYRSMAYTDLLTDMNNRNAYDRDRQDLRADEGTCCVMLDINGLKHVNDTFGHHCGDNLIRRCARVIRDSFSSVGDCYRIGGDEFTVICKNIDEAAVKNAVAEMERRIAAANTDSEPEIGLACGYAFGGNGIDTVTALFAAADKAMYHDKEKERISQPQ